MWPKIYFISFLNIQMVQAVEVLKKDKNLFNMGKRRSNHLLNDQFGG